MDDMEDFGDLYGDLDYRRTDKKEGDDLESTPTDVDSVEESESNGKATALEPKGIENLEEENINNSDSDEDDFRIVLNEDERPKFWPLRGGITGIDEDEDFDKVTDHLNTDQRRSDQLPVAAADELLRGSEVRGVGTNGGQRPSRHVGSHLVGSPSSLRSSVPGRGGWGKSSMTCFPGSASYNRDSSTAAQNGGIFCLPRYRTIFDINIEVFEQKPWRHHGADITDYFNFGLDEENWKSYCQALDQRRKQTMVSNRFPAYQSSRLDEGGRDFSVIESSDMGGRRFDMPKGRAIQVEGGLGERIPSTDLRRPRALGSDVVIHINMEGSVEDASCKGSLEQAGEYIDASLSTSGNNSNERPSSRQDGGQNCRHVTHSVGDYSSTLNESNSRVTSWKINSTVGCNKDDEKDLFKMDACAWSDSGDQVPRYSRSGNLESHSNSKESNDSFSPGKKARHIKNPSPEDLKDSIESDYYRSDGSLGDATDSDVEEDSKIDAHEHDLFTGKYKHFSQTRLKSVAEINGAKKEELSSSVIHRKHQKNLDLRDANRKTRKRKFYYDTDDVRGHTYSYRETKVSLSCRSRTQATKHGSDDSFPRDSRKGDFVTHRNGSWNEYNCLAQKHMYFSESCCEERVRRSSVRKHCNQSVSKNKSFFKEKDSCLRPAKEREGDRHIRMHPEDYVYKEHHGEDTHGRHTNFYETEENFEFRRHAYPIERKPTSPERGRYGNRFSFLDRSSQYSDNGVDHRLVSRRYKESSSTGRRDGYDACLPGEHLRIPWRSNGRYLNHRDHPNVRELQFKNKTYGHVIPNIKDRHHSPHKNGIGSEKDGYISEGNAYYKNIVSSIHKRNNRLAKLNLCMDTCARVRRCEQGDLPSAESFLFERSSEHDKFNVSKPLFRGQRLLGGRPLKNARKLRVCETSDLDGTDHANFVQDMDKHELTAVGCRKAVNKRVNDFKSKLGIKSSGVPGGNEENISTGYKDSLPKNSRHHKQACKQEEAYQIISKDENSLKVGEVKDSKPFNSNGHSKVSLDKFPAPQNLEDTELEEGELIEESDKKDTGWSSRKKPDFKPKDSMCNGKASVVYDNNHILQTLAKMEKRRERFKEPVVPKQPPETNVAPELDVSVVSEEAKPQQRPARKRRWGGN